MSTENNSESEPSDRARLADRIEALEAIVDAQQETIEALEAETDCNREETETGESLSSTSTERDGPAGPSPLGRRSVLAGLGLAGVAGLGATTGAGHDERNVSGRIGTSERPLETLVTSSIDGVPTSNAFELTVEDGEEAGNIVAGHSENGVDEDAVGATITGGGSEGSPNAASGSYATVGGGADNEVTGDDSTVSGGTSNAATEQRSTVGGGYYNQADGVRSTIAGGSQNYASNNDATIAGGNNNDATGGQATVGGGFYNEATATYSTAGGGRYNEASGANSTVGGGQGNEASGNNSTVCGGSGNVSSGLDSTVSGGTNNEAGGRYAAIPGGGANVATGSFSFAAGRQAMATHDGAFVFADSSIDPVHSGGEDEARFQMEVYAPSFLNSSARETKTAIEPVDPGAVLKDLTSLEVSAWEFVEHDSGRHMGPMAEDFAETFELGTDDGSISSIDSYGVAFAAIQGLAQKLDAAKQCIDELDSRLEQLEDDSPTSMEVTDD